MGKEEIERKTYNFFSYLSDVNYLVLFLFSNFLLFPISFSSSFSFVLFVSVFHIGGVPQMPIYWTNEVLKANWKVLHVWLLN